MAERKFNSYPPANTITGAEVLLIAQSGATLNTTPNQILQSGLAPEFGVVTAENIILTSAQSVSNVLAAPTNAPGAPVWRQLTTDDIGGVGSFFSSPPPIGDITPNLVYSSGGALNGTIGATTPASGAFTSLSGNVEATGSTTPRALADWFADVVNVKAQGAVADAQYASPAITCTSGGTTITTDAALFAPGDVGKAISITIDAETQALLPQGCTITGYTSATQITISAGALAAETASPGQIVWATDSAPAFAAAFAAVSARGTVYVPAGSYGYTYGSFAKNNTTLMGAGRTSTIIYAINAKGSRTVSASFPSGALFWNAAAATLLTYSGAPLAPGAQSDHGFTISDLTFDMTGNDYGAGGGSMIFFQAQDIRISNVGSITRGNFAGGQMQFPNCYDVTIENCETDLIPVGMGVWDGACKIKIIHNNMSDALGWASSTPVASTSMRLVRVRRARRRVATPMIS